LTHLKSKGFAGDYDRGSAHHGGSDTQKRWRLADIDVVSLNKMAIVADSYEELVFEADNRFFTL
jgi:hypothetical protein